VTPNIFKLLKRSSGMPLYKKLKSTY